VEEGKPSSVYTNVVDIWSFGCVIYKIVAKQVPFRNGGDIKRFCDNRIPFPTESLQCKLTTNGIDFLQSILVAKPLARPTTEVALQHPWLLSEDDSLLQESTGSPKKKELAAIGEANTWNDVASNDHIRRHERLGSRNGETQKVLQNAAQQGPTPVNLLPLKAPEVLYKDHFNQNQHLQNTSLYSQDCHNFDEPAEQRHQRSFSHSPPIQPIQHRGSIGRNRQGNYNAISSSRPLQLSVPSYSANVNRQKTKVWAEAKPADYGDNDWGDDYDDNSSPPAPPMPNAISSSRPLQLSAPSYPANVNRQKTKKWAEAKPAGYGDDDWGDNYDDYSFPPAAPMPKPTGLRQPSQMSQSPSSGRFPSDQGNKKAYGDLPAIPTEAQPRSATNPVRDRAISFTQDNKRRAFSVGYAHPSLQNSSPLSSSYSQPSIIPQQASAPLKLNNFLPLKPIFGINLGQLYDRDCSAVPTVVYQCIQAVDLFGLEVEGIYRLSGNASHVNKLKAMFDNGQ
jgi:hypothetical protein